MPVEILIVLVLILTNGFFALSEMAVMTSRKARLRQRARDSARARTALELAEQPERFLSSVQVWITLLGILTGYVGGESIAASLQPLLARIDALSPWAEPISVAIAVGLILLASVVIGELVPKRLAILAPERVATAVAVPMRVLALAAKPAVVFLAGCTTLLLRPFGLHRGLAEKVTEEEIKFLVAEGAEQGVIDTHERDLVNRALTLGDRSVDSLMTPRPEIVWLDVTRSREENLTVMRESRFTRYPVCRGSEQDVVGVLHVKRLIDAISGEPVDLFAALDPPLFVPDAARALHVLQKFRASDSSLALVVDEYGDIQGMVTPNDILIAVFGRLAQTVEDGDAPVVQRADGSWLVDGRVSCDDLRELLGVAMLPHEGEHEFRTAAGLMMVHFGRIPQAGEYFSDAGFRFEVIDLDGARIDKILVSRAVPPEPEGIV